MPFKLEFSDFVLEKMNELQKEKPVIITGDFNTAHNEIDIANPKSNQKSTGFLPIERAWMDKFISHGWIDIFRHIHPEKAGVYLVEPVKSKREREKHRLETRLFFHQPKLITASKKN